LFRSLPYRAGVTQKEDMNNIVCSFCVTLKNERKGKMTNKREQYQWFELKQIDEINRRDAGTLMRFITNFMLRAYQSL